MWCRYCSIETKENKYPICGLKTVDDVPVEIIWCENSSVPGSQEISQSDKEICPRCGGG